MKSSHVLNDLSGNIPPEIGKMIALVELNLNKNVLSGIVYVKLNIHVVVHLHTYIHTNIHTSHQCDTSIITKGIIIPKSTSDVRLFIHS